MAKEKVAWVLQQLVVDKIDELGPQRAQDYFGVDARMLGMWRASAKAPIWAIEKVYLENLAGEDRCLTSDNAPTIGANWEGKQVIMCLPWYKTVSPYTALSLLATMDQSKMGVLMACGDAFISHTRNKLAQAFLETDAEWSFWVDDDMIVPMGRADWFLQVTGAGIRAEWAGQHAINRLLSHEKPLVGALYTGRHIEGRLMFAEGCNDPQETTRLRREGPRNEVRPTRWVATGCLLVHRKVFEAIDKKYPHLKRNFFSPSEHDLFEALQELRKALEDSSLTADDKIGRALNLLERGSVLANVNSRVGVGEDVIFCVRAGQAGFQAHIDLGLVCGHQGSAVYGPWNTRPSFTGGTR